MSQQSLFIADGGGSNNTANVAANNTADGGYSLQGLVAQYNLTPPTITDTFLTFLQTDAYGALKVTFPSGTDNDSANPGSANPAQTAWIGASDGTNLQGLLVESSTRSNLRTSLYYGSTEMIVGLDGYTAVHQADSPWIISGTVTANQGGAWTVAATQSGTWTVQQGTPPWSFVGTYAADVAPGSDAIKGLVGRYQSTPSAITDGNLTYLQTDSYGQLKVTFATSADNDAANPGSAAPTQTSWMGGSDAFDSGNLHGFMVESATVGNQRVSLWDGTTKANIIATNNLPGFALETLNAQYISTGGATALTEPVDGYSFAYTQVNNSRLTYAQTDGYGRLEVRQAREVAFAYENRANQTVLLKSGAGCLRKVIIGNAGANNSLITFYDNTVAGGTVIAKINPSNVLGQIEFAIPFQNGLTYVTNNRLPGDVTITFE